MLGGYIAVALCLLTLNPVVTKEFLWVPEDTIEVRLDNEGIRIEFNPENVTVFLRQCQGDTCTPYQTIAQGQRIVIDSNYDEVRLLVAPAGSTIEWRQVR